MEKYILSCCSTADLTKEHFEAIDSLGIQGLRKLEKCQVDVLGNISFVQAKNKIFFPHLSPF